MDGSGRQGKRGGSDRKALPAARGGRLPSGRHGLPRELVVENQRERIITALVDCISQRGYAATTVTQIIKAAGVSRVTFYEHFANKEACFLAAQQMVADHLRSLAREAAEGPDTWPEQVRACIAALLRFFAAEPELARVVLIEPVAVGGEATKQGRTMMRHFAQHLRAGRELPGAERLPEAIEETLVGGCVALVVREIAAGRTKKLELLLPQLVGLALAPYLGAREASRVAAQA